MTVPGQAPVPTNTVKRKTTSGGMSTNSRAVKRRASKACQCCRSRKVRCDVVESGIPCTNCRLDEVECCVTEGKRRRKSCIDGELQASPAASSCGDRDEVGPFPLFDDIDGVQDWTLPGKSSAPYTIQQRSSQHKPHMPYRTQMSRITPEEQTRRLSILNARGIPVQDPAALTSPYFPAFQLQNQVVLPAFTSTVPPRICAEDVEYLQKKGAFLTPDTGLRNELLRNYVQFVHPYLPLLELEDFITTIYRNDGESPISLLLFQAVMFAATAYIDMRFLAAQGYESRKAARKAFFQRVKLLYDFDYETDRVAVVQSVLLMTYWYESPDDPKDVWHWLGVSISLARTIGLNCDTSASSLPVHKQKHWKRIWWCCYMRDRLVSIGMRRPIRIQEDDFEVSTLQLSDFETHSLAPELTRMLGGCSVIKDAEKRVLLARMCMAVVTICQCMTRVLAAQYSVIGHRLGATQETTMRLVPRKSAAEPADITSCDQELELWYNELPAELRYYKTTSPRERNVCNDGEVLNLHRALLTGIYLTTSSALHRPQMMPASPNLIIAPEMKDLSRGRVREAASATTDVYRDLYDHDLIRYLPNTGVTVLLPAIIVHLLDIRSLDSETRNLSTRRFHFCMQALQKLRDIYASADFAYSFLDAAIKKADVAVSDDSIAQVPRHARSLPDNVYRPSTGAKLTPPPEPIFQHARSLSQSATGSLHCKTITLPQIQLWSHSVNVVTPPRSDRSVTSSDAQSTSRVTVNDRRPVQPMDVGHADHGGDIYIPYTDLEHSASENEDLDMVDEEAMKQDFDQLIDLDGGEEGILFGGERKLGQNPLDGMNWDLIEASAKSLSSGVKTEYSSALENRIMVPSYITLQA